MHKYNTLYTQRLNRHVLTPESPATQKRPAAPIYAMDAAGLLSHVTQQVYTL